MSDQFEGCKCGVTEGDTIGSQSIAEVPRDSDSAGVAYRCLIEVKQVVLDNTQRLNGF